VGRKEWGTHGVVRDRNKWGMVSHSGATRSQRKVAVHVQDRVDFLQRLIVRGELHSADCEFPDGALGSLSSSAAYVT